MKPFFIAAGRPALGLITAALLTACGSGGDATPTSPPPPPSGTASFTLTGVVAKGTLRNAVVKAHPVVANGSVDTTTTLAEAISNDSGQYTLTFSGTSGVPYVVRVTPRPAGQTPATTQVDEISGATPVAEGFALRALFVPVASGAVSTSTHITPFSEFAVAAAEKGTGGVNVANANQARVNITALLGFDPTTVTPTTIAAASTGDAQRLTLATMLTAVSKLANDRGLGCSQPTLAERVNCVVGRLSTSATLASTNPGSVSGVNVAAALVAATEAVVAANNLAPTAAGPVIDNLRGAGTPPPATIGNDTQSGIAAAKSLFTSVRSDWQSVLGGGANGAAASQAARFRDAMNAVQSPADVLLTDTGAIVTGIDLYRDFMAGRTMLNNRGRGDARDYVQGGDINNAGLNRFVTGCTLYSNAANLVPAATPAQVREIGCQAIFFMRRYAITGGYAVETWRHGFTILPGSVADSFTYTTRSRRSIEECKPNCVRTINDALQTNFYAGTVSITADSAQHIVAFTIGGELPGAFVSGGNTLVNERHTWSVSGSRSIGAVPGENSATVTGTIASFATGAVAPSGTLKITEATLNDVPVSRTASGGIVRRGHPTAVANAGGETASGVLPVEWTAGTSSFIGRLALTESMWDASGTSHIPTRVVLSGQFRNTDAGTGVTTEFINGNFTVTSTGWATFNDTLLKSATNTFTLGFQFGGQITAPGRPTLALTMAASRLSHQEATTQTVQYRTLVGGVPTQTINIVATQPAVGPRTLSFSEAAANVSMNYVQDAATATLRRGTVGNGTELGTLNTSSMLLTFVDGTTMSLDFGL